MADCPRPGRKLYIIILLAFFLICLAEYVFYRPTVNVTTQIKTASNTASIRDDFRPGPVTGTLNPSTNAFIVSLALAQVNSTATNHSNQNGVDNHQPLDYEIVISHYNENLDWAKPLADHSHVYHKGKEKGPPFDVYKWEKLPNVGREAHTYLHHIIHNYDNLANITVFLQGTGTGREHTYWCFASPMEFVERARRHEYCNIRQRYGGWGFLRHLGKWLVSLENGQMRQANLTMGEFYTALFGTKPPDGVPVCLTACISASKENLRQFPVSFYEKAISFVNDHSNPEEAHYFERLWATIIYTKKSWIELDTLPN